MSIFLLLSTLRLLQLFASTFILDAASPFRGHRTPMHTHHSIFRFEGSGLEIRVLRLVRFGLFVLRFRVQILSQKR